MNQIFKRGLALLLCLFSLAVCVPTVCAAETQEPGSQTVATEDASSTDTTESIDTSVDAAATEETSPELTAEEPAEPAAPESPASDAERTSDTSADAADTADAEDTGDQADGVALASSADYDFSTILASSQTTSANCYLTYVGGSGTKAVSIHQVTTGGSTYWAYCADARKDWPGSYSDFTKTALPSSGFYQVQRVVLALGFGDNNTARLKQLFGYSLNNYEAYQATQIVLWAAQVWEEQWSYLGSAPATIRAGVENYWQVKTPSGKSANARNFALALADAAQTVYEDGFSGSLAMTQDSTTQTTVRYKLTVKTSNYFGGYTAALTGAPSGSTLTGSGNVTISSASKFSSTTTSGTDTLYLTVPKTAAAQSLTLKLTVSPYVRQYSSNSALNFLTPADSAYQAILCSGGTLTVPTVSKSLSATVPRLVTGQITITKLDAETKQAAPGVVFALYEYDADTEAFLDSGLRATSDSKGKAVFSKLQYSARNKGLYRVFEVSSEDYQVWGTSRYVCSVSLNSGHWNSYEMASGKQLGGDAVKNSSGSYDFTFSFTAYNQPKVQYGSLTIQKQDGSQKPLSGTAFVITTEDGSALRFTKASDGSYQPTEQGGTVLSTDSAGKLLIRQLELGTYLVTEVQVSDGTYTLLPTSFTVTLPTDGSSELTYTVVNRSGFRLPATGGSGFLPFAVVSLAMLVSLFYWTGKEYISL